MTLHTKKTPLVSVAVPAYNAARFLLEAIETVRYQTYKHWELIVVDNASTDATPAILKHLAETTDDPRVRLFRNPSTVSAPENWNIAISHARGDLLKLLCADDLMLPDCLARQVQALSSYPTASLAAGSRIIINSVGRQLFVRNGIGRSDLYPGQEMIRRCIMAGTNIIGDPVNVLWRRSAMEQVGVFDHEVKYCIDIDYWLRLLAVGDLYFDAKPVGMYRIHAQALATGFGDVTVEDFLRMAQKQVAKGSLRLSSFDRCIVGWKSWLASIARQAVYRTLG